MYDVHTTPTSTDFTTATSSVSVNGPDDIRDGGNNSSSRSSSSSSSSSTSSISEFARDSRARTVAGAVKFSHGKFAPVKHSANKRRHKSKFCQWNIPPIKNSAS